MKLIQVKCPNPNCNTTFFTTLWALKRYSGYFCLGCKRTVSYESTHRIRDPSGERGSAEYTFLYYCGKCGRYYAEDRKDYSHCSECTSGESYRFVQDLNDAQGEEDD